MFCDLKNGLILVAEDNPDDAVLLKRAFIKAGIHLALHVCADGEDATAYLEGTDKYSNRALFPFPRMLITDLKMPLCDGFELLDRSASTKIPLIPKVVMSSSREDRDVRRAFDLGAHCYFMKPSTFDELVGVVRLLMEFWSKSLTPSQSV